MKKGQEQDVFSEDNKNLKGFSYSQQYMKDNLGPKYEYAYVIKNTY